MEYDMSVLAELGAEERVREALGGMERYWIRAARRGVPDPWVEVDKQSFVEFERAAGFHNTLGQPDEPATSAFCANGIEGVTTWGKETP